MMARTTLTNDTVREALEASNASRSTSMNMARSAERCEIRAVPTFLILMPSEEPVVITTGFPGHENFCGLVDQRDQRDHRGVDQENRGRTEARRSG